MKKLSEEQQTILQAIDNFIEKMGYSPSVRELCKITGRNSPATIQYHLRNLKQMGYINYNEKQSRTIRIIRKG